LHDSSTPLALAFHRTVLITLYATVVLGRSSSAESAGLSVRALIILLVLFGVAAGFFCQ